jgi:hypothetical protein
MAQKVSELTALTGANAATGDKLLIDDVSAVASKSITLQELFTLADNTKLILGTGGDMSFTWDGTSTKVTQAAPNSAIEWGISGAGIDHIFYGDTATRDMTWDQSADSLIFNDSAKLVFGTGSDITALWDGTDLLVSQATADSIIKWGVSGAGINHVFYGDTATRDCTWDQSNDQLIFNDNAKLAIGTGGGAAGDITLSWDATKLLVAQLTANSAIDWGVDGAGLDQNWYGDTASAKMMFDQSADSLIFSGVAGIQGAVVKTNGATAITTTRAVTRADSGGMFTVDQGTAYTITVATPLAAGERYLFQLIGPAAHDVTLVATTCTFEGTITIDASTIPATGSTLKFASGAAVLGDSIELVATSTSKFYVRAISSGAGGITIA